MSGRLSLIVVAALVLAATLGAQVANDACANATPIAEGVLVNGSNVGASSGPDPVACSAGNDVWYALNASCNAQYIAATCAAGTSFDTVLSVWSGSSGCGALTLVACNDNNCAIPGLAQASRVTFTATAGALYYVSVGGKLGATGTFALQVAFNPVMTLAFFNLGPGTIGYQVTGPPGGAFYLAVALLPGAFPFGWFFGLDLPLFDIVAQVNAGPPFIGTFSPCGVATFGPVGGAPSGLTLYAVAIGFVPGSQTPTFASNPTTTTIP